MCVRARSKYVRRTLVEHYEWLGALSLMMKEREFRVRSLFFVRREGVGG